jgi:hypothetical protein
MPLNTTDRLHLNTAAGHLQLGDAMDAWHELEMITPQARAQTEVLTVRLAVCRALKNWELAEDSGNAVFELRLQTSTNLVTQPFSDYGDPITNTIPMPGRAGFLRVRAVDTP